MAKIAVYPGSFDPITNGHIDIIRRGVKLFDRVIVTVLNNPVKKGLFTPEERIDMIRSSTKDCPNVDVDYFDGLLVDYCVRMKADAILRGMRALSDFEFEFQMALMNRRLNRNIETVFLMTSMDWIFTSSTIIKEAARFGGNIVDLVPPMVCRRLKEKFHLDGI